MKTTFSLFALFYSIMSFGDVFEVYFDIDNEGKSYEILDLNASVKAKKIIRDNAYLSFSMIKNKKPKNNIYSDCWLDFIKNKKINIQTSENSFSLIKSTLEKYTYKINFNPNKIKVLNVNQKDFLNFCENQS